MKRGAVRRLFLGSNAADGFWSHHHHLVGRGVARAFILKGGPGVGKSTFIRGLTTDLAARGYDAELYVCSSDPSSVDGVLFPRLKVSVVDGTAPHTIDPGYPGAVEEIINLGDCLDTGRLVRMRSEIIRLVDVIRSRFERVYSQLRVCGAARDVLVEVYQRCVDEFRAGRLITEIMARCESAEPLPARRLAVSAVTPDGPVSFVDDYIAACDESVLIGGPVGAGTSLVEELVRRLAHRSRQTELMVCGLQPARMEHLRFRGFGVFTVCQPHSRGEYGDAVSEADWLHPGAVDDHADDIKAAETVYWAALDHAAAGVAEARRLHRQLEAIYGSAMDFSAADRCRRRVLRRVLRLGPIDCP